VRDAKVDDVREAALVEDDVLYTEARREGNSQQEGELTLQNSI
jgi:hypothetical protein